MAMGMGGGKDSSGPEGLGADAFGGGGTFDRIAFYMDDNWGFNPSFDPSAPIEGRSLTDLGLDQEVSLAQGLNVESNPSKNFSIGSTYGGPNNYGFGVKASNLFGVAGLGVQAGYGKGGGMGMISYGGNL